MESSSHVCCGVVRGYILYLRHRPEFHGHPYTPEQNVTLSPQTIRGHIRALKAFSTWLYLEGYTTENRLKNLKLPKAPAKIVEPLSPDEIKRSVASINKNSPVDRLQDTAEDTNNMKLPSVSRQMTP